MSTQKINLPSLWDDASLRPYLGEVRRKHGIVETLALPSMRDLPSIRIETLFVAPLLSSVAVNADSDPNSWPIGESLFESFNKNHQLVILGDPGGGKTTLSNWLAWRLASGSSLPLPKFLQDRIPVPCVLRDMPVSIFNSNFNTIDLALKIMERLLGEKLDAELVSSIQLRVATGRYVLILDGVDEIPINSRKTVARWIRESKELNACVLATSRIVGYEDYPVDKLHIGDFIKESNDWNKSIRNRYFHEISAFQTGLFSDPSLDFVISNPKEAKVFEINKKSFKDKNIWAKQLFLMPFDNTRVAAFAENWYRERYSVELEAKEKTSDFLISLNKSEVTKRLARTPNLLSLMAIVHRERAHLPDGKAELYEDIANAYINTIDKQRKIVSGDTLSKFTWTERKAWLAYIGFKMQQLRYEESKKNSLKSEAGVLVSEKVVLSWITEAMEVSDIYDADSASKTFLSWVARRSGLLLPRGEGRYAFVHLSFQEYFCACYLQGKIVSPDFLANSSFQNELVEWANSNLWRETLVFLFELISTQQASTWVDTLASILFDKESEFHQLEHNNASLAARIISDTHIKLSAKWRDKLADRCIYTAWQDSNAIYSDDELSVLPPLLDSNYAAILIDNKAERIDNGDFLDRIKSIGLQYKVITNSKLDDVELDSKVRLIFSHCKKLNNLKRLEKYTNLRLLYLDRSNVSSLNILKKITNLFSLSINHTKIKSLKPISKCLFLSNLEFSGTDVDDIFPIINLKGLDSLCFNDTKVADISPLINLNNLGNVEFRNTQVFTLEPLSDLKLLRSIDAGYCKITDINCLKNLKNIYWLNISGNEIKNIDVLVNFQKLKHLAASNTKISNINALSDLKELSVLTLNNTDVNSLDCLKDHRNLTNVELDKSNIKDISPLLNSSNNIKQLSIDFAKLLNYEILGEFKSLNFLSLSNTNLEDINWIPNLKNLIFLNLSDTLIKDFRPLKLLKELRVINIDNTTITHQSAIEIFQDLPDVTIRMGGNFYNSNNLNKKLVLH